MKFAVTNQNPGQINNLAIRLGPPWFIEYGFYASLFYALMGPVVGIQIDRLGIVILALLSSLCVLGMRERPLDFFRTLVVPIGFGISHLIIQLMYHGLSIQDGYVKPFIPWIFTLFIVQALLFRKGFLHRFVLFALLVGSITLLFLDFREGGDGVTRVGLDREVAGLSNPNALANWFGFCTVYFFNIGLITKRQKTRITSWVIATACLYVVTLTVSRGALLATIVGIILGSREFLKRGFIPLLLLFVFAWIAYGLGLFDQAISYYAMRGTEETGRFLVWPRAFEGFINVPFTGAGANDVYLFLPEKRKIVTPHNGFLLIALASGVFPLIMYAAYWIQATWAAIWPKRRIADASLLPLVGFSFLCCLSGNITFMAPWVVVTLGAALASSIPNRSATARVVRDKKVKKRALR